MFTKRNNSVESALMPLYQGKEIVIAIDSSKSNTGITIGDMYGRKLDIIEFNGVNDGTTKKDVLELCIRQREALSIILEGSKPKIVGIEDIISKKRKENNYHTGIDEHLSRFKITAVFMSFIFFFQDKFGITPELINNQAWKVTVLPEEFRTREHRKGSLDYFKSIGSEYMYYSDDATDSLCIFYYLCIVHKLKNNGKLIEMLELNQYEHSTMLVSGKLRVPSEYQKFVYNKEFTLEQNADVMSNNIRMNEVAYAIVDVEQISLSDIYKYVNGKVDQREDILYLVVIRVKTI